MAEGKQINIWAPAELVARLEEIQPSGVALAVVARKLIEEGLGAAADLPRLSGAGRTIAQVDFSKVLTAIDDLDDRLKEVQRSVHEHGGWIRGRVGSESEASKAAAKDYGEDRVRKWEKSVGRGDWA